jgi:hypothetical protein
MSNKLYDVLKWVVMIVLPAISTLYVALAGIWGWPYADEAAGTIGAITTFMGAVLMFSTAQYNKKANEGAE